MGAVTIMLLSRIRFDLPSDLAQRCVLDVPGSSRVEDGSICELPPVCRTSWQRDQSQRHHSPF